MPISINPKLTYTLRVRDRAAFDGLAARAPGIATHLRDRVVAAMEAAARTVSVEVKDREREPGVPAILQPTKNPRVWVLYPKVVFTFRDLDQAQLGATWDRLHALYASIHDAVAARLNGVAGLTVLRRTEKRYGRTTEVA